MTLKTFLPLTALLLAMSLFSCDPEESAAPLPLEEEPNLESYYEYQGTKAPLEFAYQTSYGWFGEEAQVVSIYLTVSDVSNGGALTGTSDMVNFTVTTDGDRLQEGSYQIGEDRTDGQVLYSFYCKQLNFRTYEAEVDDQTLAGTITVSDLPDNEYHMLLELQMESGDPLVAEYSGSLELIED